MCQIRSLNIPERGNLIITVLMSFHACIPRIEWPLTISLSSLQSRRRLFREELLQIDFSFDCNHTISDDGRI